MIYMIGYVCMNKGGKLMSFIRMYRNKFINNNDLEYLYVHHSLKFVEYIEQQGLGDKIIEISSQQLTDSVKHYHEKGVIQTVSTMNNHLNAIKRFFVFLHKEGIADNIFGRIPDYDAFKQDIINENELKPASQRGYFEADQIKELLDYFNSHPQKYSNTTMIAFFFKITLLIPAKRKIIANLKIGDFTEEFDSVKINGFDIKLPRALSQDIQTEIKKSGRELMKDDLFFEVFCQCKYSDNVFNTPFYHALKEIGYDVPKDKDTFSVECIRNTGIVNLTINGVNPYLISRMAGLSLSSLENLLDKFKIEIDEQADNNRIINQEISKFQFYQQM